MSIYLGRGITLRAEHPHGHCGEMCLTSDYTHYKNSYNSAAYITLLAKRDNGIEYIEKSNRTGMVFVEWDHENHCFYGDQ